jgi:hypothetical protein
LAHAVTGLLGLGSHFNATQIPIGQYINNIFFIILKIKNIERTNMPANSSVTAASILGVVDPSIKVIKTINQPYIKQFMVISRKSTTGVKPNLYSVKIEANTPEITPQSKIKVYCDCLDFRYRQAFCFNEKGALLNPPNYVIEPPDKTNPGCGKFQACKHIKSAIKYAIERGL